MLCCSCTSIRSILQYDSNRTFMYIVEYTAEACHFWGALVCADFWLCCLYLVVILYSLALRLLVVKHASENCRTSSLPMNMGEFSCIALINGGNFGCMAAIFRTTSVCVCVYIKHVAAKRLLACIHTYTYGISTILCMHQWHSLYIPLLYLLYLSIYLLFYSFSLSVFPHPSLFVLDSKF